METLDNTLPRFTIDYCSDGVFGDSVPVAEFPCSDSFMCPLAMFGSYLSHLFNCEFSLVVFLSRRSSSTTIPIFHVLRGGPFEYMSPIAAGANVTSMSRKGSRPMSVMEVKDKPVCRSGCAVVGNRTVSTAIDSKGPDEAFIGVVKCEGGSKPLPLLRLSKANLESFFVIRRSKLVMRHLRSLIARVLGEFAVTSSGSPFILAHLSIVGDL
jgi:hypothetical protein